MEVDLLTLVEMRYDKQALAPYEAAYQAESEGCYGTLGNALEIILKLSWQKYDAMKGLSGCFSNLSIQTDSVPLVTPQKRSAPSIADQQEPIEDEPVDQEPLLALQEPLVLSPSRRLRGKCFTPYTT